MVVKLLWNERGLKLLLVYENSKKTFMTGVTSSRTMSAINSMENHLFVITWD